MADSRHEAVWDWLMTCPHIKDLYFNFSQSKNGDTVLEPLMAYSDTVNETFCAGASERFYDFALIRFEAHITEANDTQNMEVLVDVEAIAAWVEAQAKAGNYPVFPADCTVTDIMALPSNIGYVAARDETGAKYSLEFRIEYLFQPTP